MYPLPAHLCLPLPWSKPRRCCALLPSCRSFFPASVLRCFSCLPFVLPCSLIPASALLMCHTHPPWRLAFIPVGFALVVITLGTIRVALPVRLLRAALLQLLAGSNSLPGVTDS
jgi:hypothetical protein